MSDDDGECSESPTGAHWFVLDELAPGSKGGLAMVYTCAECGATAYAPSAADDPHRPPL